MINSPAIHLSVNQIIVSTANIYIFFFYKVTPGCWWRLDSHWDVTDWGVLDEYVIMNWCEVESWSLSWVTAAARAMTLTFLKRETRNLNCRPRQCCWDATAPVQCIIHAKRSKSRQTAAPVSRTHPMQSQSMHMHTHVDIHNLFTYNHHQNKNTLCDDGLST